MPNTHRFVPGAIAEIVQEHAALPLRPASLRSGTLMRCRESRLGVELPYNWLRSGLTIIEWLPAHSTGTAHRRGAKS